MAPSAAIPKLTTFELISQKNHSLSKIPLVGKDAFIGPLISVADHWKQNSRMAPQSTMRKPDKNMALRDIATRDARAARTRAAKTKVATIGMNIAKESRKGREGPHDERSDPASTRLSEASPRRPLGSVGLFFIALTPDLSRAAA